MNRVRPPIATALTVNPNTWEGSGAGPDREPVLFWDQRKGGFYYVTDSAATFDTAPLMKPEPPWDPYYPLEFKRADGGDTLITFGVRNGRADSAASTGNPEYVAKWRESTPKRVFKKIAQPESRVTDNERVEQAFEDELVPRIRSIKEALDSRKRYERGRGYGSNDDDARAREALCACGKTKRPGILQALRQTAKELGLREEEYKECLGDAEVSRLHPFWWSPLPVAQAATLPPKMLARLQAAGPEQLNAKGEVIEMCGGGKGWRVDLKRGLFQPATCPKVATVSDCRALGADARGCVSVGKRTAGITGAGVVLLSEDGKGRTVIPVQTPVRGLAISGSWLAIGDETGVSVYDVK